MNQTKVINDSITKKYGNRYETIQTSIEESLTEKIDMTIVEKQEETSEVEQLIQSRKNNKETIWKLTRKIEKLTDINRQLDKEIWSKCDHVWERDWSVSFDDRCKDFCKVCQLWKNQNLYR
jgi:hypothetical protein